MAKSLELFKNRIAAATAQRGSKAEIRRKTGLSGSQLDAYISGKTTPNLDSLDKVAAALGVPAWMLIAPEGAVAPPVQPSAQDILRAAKGLLSALDDTEMELLARYIASLHAAKGSLRSRTGNE